MLSWQDTPLTIRLFLSWPNDPSLFKQAPPPVTHFSYQSPRIFRKRSRRWKSINRAAASRKTPLIQFPVCLRVSQRSEHNFPKLEFTQDELQERFKRQLAIEQACTVTIDSVEAAKPVTENVAKMVSERHRRQLHIPVMSGTHCMRSVHMFASEKFVLQLSEV